MGKVKSRRQKIHTKAAKVKIDEKEHDNLGTPPTMNYKATGSVISGGGVFSKLDIDLDMLTKQFNPGGGDLDETRSAITSKSLRGMNLKKKDKRNLKHQYWMKRIDGIQIKKKVAKEKKKRQKTAVVGDMKPLEEALPILELLMKDNGKKGSQRDEINVKKSILKEKKRKKNIADDISIFQQVLKHPSFKSNPKATMNEHLHNKIEYENMDT